MEGSRCAEFGSCLHLNSVDIEHAHCQAKGRGIPRPFPAYRKNIETLDETARTTKPNTFRDVLIRDNHALNLSDFAPPWHKSPLPIVVASPYMIMRAETVASHNGIEEQSLAQNRRSCSIKCPDREIHLIGGVAKKGAYELQALATGHRVRRRGRTKVEFGSVVRSRFDSWRIILRALKPQSIAGLWNYRIFRLAPGSRSRWVAALLPGHTFLIS